MKYATTMPAKTYKSAEKKADPRVTELLGQIRGRMQEFGFSTLDDLAAAARHGIGTWHGWANGSHAPNLLLIDDFARQVGGNVRVVWEGVASTSFGEVVNTAGEASLDSVMRQLMATIGSLSEQGRRDLLDIALSYKRQESAANPHEPGAESSRPNHARHK